MPKGVFPRTALIGRKYSEEHRKAISLGLKGKTGRKHSEVTKQKMSLSHIGNKSMSGKKHSIEARRQMGLSRMGARNPLWKGGVTSINEQLRKSFEYKLWREAVFSRDNYTCIFCGDNKGGNLEADHIKLWSQYPELRFAIDNGRTLCHDCHIKVHKKNS